MKKYLFLILLTVLMLCSCTTQELKLKNVEQSDDGSYSIDVTYDTFNIDITEYVDYTNEYIVKYNDKSYISTIDDLVFELKNGQNEFTISNNTTSHTLIVNKESSYNVYFVDDNNNILKENLINDDINLTELINEYVKTNTPNGYAFDGSVYYSFNNRIFNIGNVEELNKVENLYIKPIYKKVSYTLTLKDENNVYNLEISDNQIFNYQIPEKTGYSFSGWTNGNVVLNNGDIYLSSYGTTFNSVYLPNKYELKYTDDDFEETIVVTYGEKIELKEMSKEGYNFVGWSYNGTIISDFTWNYLESITLVAVWKQNKIEVSLEAFGGEVDNMCSVTSGIINLPTPNLEGYKFKYWTFDNMFTNKVDELLLNNYNNETLYAYYELDSENLKDEFIITRLNSHASDYSELVMFDGTKSGFTSLYWHKIALVKKDDAYYISAIAPSGQKLSSLGTYDFVVLAYSDYANYNDFVKGNYEVGDTVKFFIDPTTQEDGQFVNIMSIVKSEIGEDIMEVQNYLKEQYGGVTEVASNIDLVSSYHQYPITWKSSNKDAISSKGVYTKPFINRTVTLTACINDEEIYSFEVSVIGEHEKSTALATGYIYTPYSTITQNAMNALDIIYCAFLDIDENANWVNLTRVTNNINTYIRDKAEKAGTKIVVSVNQDGSGKFSAVAASATLREKLADNILKVVEDLDLDGIDIDWETPSSSEATNFTLMMEAIYRKLKAADPNYLVTAAIGGGKWAPPKYDLPNSKNYLDYVNLMTYSMATGNGYYQNSLYKSTKGATLVSCSIEESIEIYDELTVPRSKILVGIPFYTTVQTESGGPGSKTGSGKSIWYNQLFTTYKLSDTMKEYYDEECGVPYRYDALNKIFISFDNERSIKQKCDYINTLGLAGIMYWQYGQDVDDMLSNAIAKYINA